MEIGNSSGISDRRSWDLISSIQFKHDSSLVSALYNCRTLQFTKAIDFHRRSRVRERKRVRDLHTYIYPNVRVHIRAFKV